MKKDYKDNKDITQYKSEDVDVKINNVAFVPVHSNRSQVAKQTDAMLKLVDKMQKGEIKQLAISELSLDHNEKILLRQRLYGCFGWIQRSRPELNYKLYQRGVDIFVRRK